MAARRELRGGGVVGAVTASTAAGPRRTASIGSWSPRQDVWKSSLLSIGDVS
jgi:hypothetical protein